MLKQNTDISVGASNSKNFSNSWTDHYSWTVTLRDKYKNNIVWVNANQNGNKPLKNVFFTNKFSKLII